jgi:hypothetical protein
VSKRRLTRDDETVRDIAPQVKHKLVVPDAVLPRLLLVVHPSGSKSWALRTYPRPGVPSTRRIGTWPAMLVQDARLKAALFDPGKAAKRDGSSGAGEIAADTVAAIAKDFIVRHVERNKLRTQDEIRAAVPRDHAERVLGHAMPGVEGVYDQYSYQTEKGEALAKLASLVAKIVKAA